MSQLEVKLTPEWLSLGKSYQSTENTSNNNNLVKNITSLSTSDIGNQNIIRTNNGDKRMNNSRRTTSSPSSYKQNLYKNSSSNNNNTYRDDSFHLKERKPKNDRSSNSSRFLSQKNKDYNQQHSHVNNHNNNNMWVKRNFESPQSSQLNHDPSNHYRANNIDRRWANANNYSGVSTHPQITVVYPVATSNSKKSVSEPSLPLLRKTSSSPTVGRYSSRDEVSNSSKSSSLSSITSNTTPQPTFPTNLNVKRTLSPKSTLSRVVNLNDAKQSQIDNNSTDLLESDDSQPTFQSNSIDNSLSKMIENEDKHHETDQMHNFDAIAVNPDSLEKNITSIEISEEEEQRLLKVFGWCPPVDEEPFDDWISPEDIESTRLKLLQTQSQN